MTEWMDSAGRMIAIIAPILGGIVWMSRRVEKGQALLIRKINKIDKHKVSYKVCDQRRAECRCWVQTKKEGREE